MEGSDRVVRLPEPVRRKARAAGAHAWLEGLPELIGALEQEWGLSIGDPFPDATEAFVAEATRADGAAVVVKLILPQARFREQVTYEITALKLADGDGCVRLLRADVDRGALLMERLGRPLSSLGVPTRARHEILCSVASRIWRPAAGCGLPTGAEKGRRLVDFIARTWDELDRPCSERAIAYALECAERRVAGHDDERAVLVHGDVHQWNTLEAGAGFKLVDPDGLLAEAEYDLGIIMREDPVELLHGDPRERARMLASLTGRDEDAIWEWGVVERVSTGLLLTQIHVQPVARQMLEAADRVVEL